MRVSRDSLIAQLHEVLMPLPFVHAAWLEGADAAARADDFSDIDLWLDVNKESVEAAFAVVRALWQSFGLLDVEDSRPHPNPDLYQCFFRSTGLSPFWFLDVCVQVHGRDVEFGVHDPFLVLFDRAGVIRVKQLEKNTFDVKTAVAEIRKRHWRWLLIEKELKRGHLLEAIAYYHDEVLDSLLELLRLRYCPGKREYRLKHVYQDLPKNVTDKLEVMYGHSSLSDLQVGLEQATEWFEAVLKEFS